MIYCDYLHTETTDSLAKLSMKSEYLNLFIKLFNGKKQKHKEEHFIAPKNHFQIKILFIAVEKAFPR